MRKILMVLPLTIIFSAFSYAEIDHSMHNSVKDSEYKYGEEYDSVNMKMHKEMSIKYSGNPDVDFVKGMIAHHQGAVDMAKVQLNYGKDPEMRKLAENIISSQEVEIKEMKEWLNTHQ